MIFAERLATFQQKLAEDADLAFLPVSSELQYLTGIPRDFPNFGRIIHPGEWIEGLWITPHHTPILALPRMTAEFSALKGSDSVEVRILNDSDDPMAFLRDILDGYKLPPFPRVALSDRMGGETVIRLQTLLDGAAFVSASEILYGLRIVKSGEEISAMRRAGAITEKVFGEVLRNLRHGMTELDIIAEVDYQLRLHGAMGPSFSTSLYNTGPNLPLSFDRMTTWRRELNPPCSVLFDFGAAVDGYCYDFGRTVAFGEPNSEFQLVHKLVMEAQQAGVAALSSKEGMTCELVDSTARQIIDMAGYGVNFRHRLGHGIGLDVHEPPFLTEGDRTELKDGMLFTVEPSILQDTGFSARVEDVVMVRSGGGERLTTGYQELFVVD